MSPRRIGRGRTQKGRSPQRGRSDSQKISAERGVFAVRRQLSPSSHSLFEGFAEKLEPELMNVGRLIRVSQLSLTVVGYNRFSKDHRMYGVPTSGVKELVPSSKRPVEATLGRLGIFGAGRKHKLSFNLIAPELEEEVLAFEDAFDNVGFPLNKDPNNDSDRPTMHLSVAFVFEDHVGHLQDPRITKKLTHLCLDVLPSRPEICFDPVKDGPVNVT